MAVMEGLEVGTDIFLCVCFTDINEIMLFNVTAMKDVLGLDRMVSQAELRLLIKDPKIGPKNEERLELYHGTGDKARYLNSHFITNELNSKWITFDVTQTVKKWLQNPGEFI